MKAEVKVAAVQMEVTWLDPEANLARMNIAVEKIMADQPADLIVFPELANSGYVIGWGPDFSTFAQKFVKTAARVPGPFTDGLAGLCKKHGIYIISGLLLTHPTVTGAVYNSAVLFGPAGNIIGIHHKLHLHGHEKQYFCAGNSVQVYPTELGNIAMLVCADLSYPEIARVATLKGAEIICVPYNFYRGAVADLDMMFRLYSCRSYENTNFVVAANRVGREGEAIFAGRSCITGPFGEFLARSEVETEDIVRATLLADRLNESRVLRPRFRDRRPELYGEVCKTFEFGY